MTKIVELCGENGCCPHVELDADQVRIGEEGNLVRLTPDEWATLRGKVLSGEL